MDEQLIELCTLVIEDLYGSFFSDIFHQLAQRGRLPASQIAQRCHLPLHQVKAGLAGLVQLRLVLHHTNTDRLSTYQVDVYKAYALLRIGKLVDLAYRAHGPLAATVIEELALLGVASLQELELRINASTSDILEVIRSLVNDRFIRKVREAHFKSVFDARQDSEAYIRGLGSLSSSKGKKAQVELDDKIDLELEKRIDPTISADSIDLAHRVNGISDNGNMNIGQDSQDGPYLFVDFAKVARGLRDRALSQKTDNRLGKPSAIVMAALLKQVELESDPFRISPMNHPSLHDQALDVTQLQFDTNRAYQSGLTDHAPRMNGWREHGATTNGVQATDPYPTAETDQDDLARQLALLKEGTFEFLRYDEPTDRWFIEKATLWKSVRDDEVMRLIGERIGHPGLRLIRMLDDKGKLDEKSLQELGLLGAKELRQTLAQLQSMGFVELQEVPREPQRQPNRTIFLWFYDAERVQKVILGQLYKTMTRLYQRLRLERERLSSTLSKIERSDVQGSEEELLGTGELLILQQWRRKESWLLGEIDRLDDSVALLRDV